MAVRSAFPSRPYSTVERLPGRWSGSPFRPRRRRCIVGTHSSKTLRPTFGWDSLTEAENSVAELVAAGLTNREVAARLFLSPHTVDSHLRHIFRKLDINSRVDLVRMVTARTLGDRSLVCAADVA